MWEEYLSELKLTKEEAVAVKQSSAPKAQRCPHFLTCGGCQLLNWDYTKQIEWKKAQLSKLFNQPIDVMGADQILSYRNKNSFSFQTTKYITTGGFFKAHSKTLIPVEHCLIQDPKAEKIFLSLLKLMKANRIEAYDDKRQTGVVRHAVVRSSESTEEIMLILVVAESPFPGRKNFYQAIRKAHPEVTTLIENLQPIESPYLLGQKESVMFGSGTISDELLGLKFKLGSRSFFQIHPTQASKMFQALKDKAQLKKEDVLIDVYSGVGAIGLLMASQVKQVYCVESNLEAVKLANKNAAENGIHNIEFIKDDATRWLEKTDVKADVLILDPPREGATEAFVKATLKLLPRQIIYVSCNPVTQKRDLSALSSHYKVTDIVGVDLFPQTVHVESMAFLTLK